MIKEVKHYCDKTGIDILTTELALILPRFTKQDRQKGGIITSLITGFIG